MKLYTTLILLFTVLLPLTIYAQQPASSNITQTLKGTVTDKNTRQSIAGVTITITTMQPVQGTATNTNGAFNIANVPVGRHTVSITYAGYETINLTDVLLTSGKETELNIEMMPASKQLSEVVVRQASGRRPLNTMAMSSARSFSPEETNRYAGAFFDPARMAQSFAGVVAGGDENQIIVRGNSPKSLQWRLEGVEIINPNHFSTEGASGGNVSMLNSTLLATSDFYTGAVPAEYNNATSGVFDLKFRKGNAERREQSFTAGVLGVGATLEGPLNRSTGASYLVSYRYSSLDLLMKMGVDISDGGVPKYQDLSFNLVWPTTKAGTFSLFGIGGSGGISNTATPDFTQWDERDDAESYKAGYRAGSAGLKHTYQASSKLYFTNIISYSGDLNTVNVDTLNRAYQVSRVYQAKFNNSAIRYAGTLNYRPNNRNAIRAGLNAGFLRYNLYDADYKQGLNRLDEILNQKGNAATLDAYAEDKFELDEALSVNAGLHTNYFNLSNSWTLEPRLGINWQLVGGQQLSLAAGTYSRLESLSYYFAKGAGQNELINSRLKPTRSAQVVLGYERLLSDRLKFKSEIYYQHLYQVPVSQNPEQNFSLLNVADNSAINSVSYTALINRGTGKNYGIELSLEKSLSKGYYFMVTSSLFDSKFKALSGQEFNTTFNTHYVGNLVAGKEWAAGRNGKNLFALNAKFIYAGGRKYSPINFMESLRQDEQVIYQNSINTLTADPYIRMDFSASYRINSRGVAHYILLDVQNLLNRENNVGYYYSTNKRSIEQAKWIGMVPTLTYRIEL